MSTLVDRVLALGRWRWTPFVALSVGSTAFVLMMTWLVPERIGSVTAPPSRSGSTFSTDTNAPQATESQAEEANTTESTSAPTPPPSRPSPRATRPERRRGFSPVIRNNDPEPPNNTAPPPDAPEANARSPEELRAAAAARASEAVRIASRGPFRRRTAPNAPDQNNEPAVEASKEEQESEAPAAAEEAAVEETESPPENDREPEQ